MAAGFIGAPCPDRVSEGRLFFFRPGGILPAGAGGFLSWIYTVHYRTLTLTPLPFFGVFSIGLEYRVKILSAGKGPRPRGLHGERRQGPQGPSARERADPEGGGLSSLGVCAFFLLHAREARTEDGP